MPEDLIERESTTCRSSSPLLEKRDAYNRCCIFRSTEKLLSEDGGDRDVKVRLNYCRVIISSSQDEGEEESNGKRSYAMNSYLSFHHQKRHQRKQPETVLPVSTFDLVEGDTSITAALGSTIYRLGGRRRLDSDRRRRVLSRDVLIFYADGPDRGWVEGPPMNSGRARDGARAVFLGNKLYVFGGRPIADDGGHWAEVVDLEDCGGSGRGSGGARWTPLVPPPPSLSTASGNLFSAVFYSNSILLGSSSSETLYAFNVILNSWTIVDPLLGRLLHANSSPLMVGPLVVGDTVYWISRELHAYDLNQKRFYSGPIEDSTVHQLLNLEDGDNNKSNSPTMLVHLAGDLFSLLWLEPGVSPRCSTLHCTKFRVCRGPILHNADNKYMMCAPVISCDSFLFQNGMVDYLDGCSFSSAFAGRLEMLVGD